MKKEKTDPLARYILIVMSVLICVCVFEIANLNGDWHMIKQRNDSIISGMEAIHHLHEARAHFKKQVQEWKNVLLRGVHDRESYEKYLNAFHKEEIYVQEHIASALAAMRKLNIGNDIFPEIEQMKHEHATIGNKYRLGLESFDIDNMQSQKIVDTMLRGVDRESSAQMDNLSELATSNVKKIIEKDQLLEMDETQERIVEMVAILSLMAIFTALIVTWSRKLQGEVARRMIAEQALGENEQRLQEIMSTLADGLYVINNAGAITYANPAATTLLDWPEKELLGQNAHSLFHHSYPDGSIYPYSDCPVYRVLTGGVNVTTDQEWFWCRDGRSIPVLLVASPILRDGKVFGVVVSVRDISERKATERELLAAKQEAESASQFKSKFLANMSHEIRTPMNGVLGMVNLALGTELSDKTREFLSHAKSSSHLLLRVINDILDYSKIESNKLHMDSVDFYLGDVLADAINLFRQIVIDKMLELVVSAPLQSVGQLMGDRLRIQQILVNLMGNAVKFTKEGEIHLKVVVVEQTETMARLEFSVKDTGIGLTEAQIAKLFSPFVQADGSTTRKFGGTGLGLTICKRLVEMMGGEIWVTSTPNVGSTFCFTLCLGINQQPTPLSSILPADLLGVKSLVVDDNSAAQLVAIDMLAHIGMEATGVESGPHCLEALKVAVRQGSPYKLILLDWLMPEMDGIETAQAIIEAPELSDNNRPKIVMMTAFGKENIVKKAQKIGVDAFLIKPAPPALLLNTILDLFGKSVVQTYDARNKMEKMDKTEMIQRVGGAQVLVAEDNLINQRVIWEILESVGIDVTLANNGQEAVHLLQHRDFELVFMDVQMPIMDGYQATRQLRSEESFKSLPIIAMTAHALAGDRELCLATGMSDYISKPIDIKQLYRILTEWIQPRTDSKKITALPSKTGEEEHATSLPDLLPGIDIPAALQRMDNNARLLKELLLTFYQKYSEAAEKVRTLLAETQVADREAAGVLVHSIRGVSGNLSAEQLFSAAQDLEEAIKKGQQEAWPHLLELFEHSLAQVVQSIQPLVEEAEKAALAQTTAAPPRLDDADLARQLRQLYTFVRESHSGAKKLFASLKPALYTEEVQQDMANLESSLGQRDFDGALPHLVSIAKNRAIDLED